MNKQEILLELSLVNQKLLKILEEIQDKNSNGEQFDYCTNPSLSDIVDRIIRKVEDIEKIVYQKEN